MQAITSFSLHSSCRIFSLSNGLSRKILSPFISKSFSAVSNSQLKRLPYNSCIRNTSTVFPPESIQSKDDDSASEIINQKNEFTLPENVPTFQEAIQRLQNYWSKAGCAILQPSNTEVGAGTMNPATFLRVLGPEPWNVAYVEPSVRPDDSRYGENPNRVQQHTQFQVILKPDPSNAQELYLGSLAALGIDTGVHDVRFVEDNWESPVLGAWGLGWEVWLNGMEITQFTYFQQAGSLSLNPVSVEITYGLERIIMSLQGVDHFKKIVYSPGVTYGELFLENEKEMSCFNLEYADVERAQKRFDIYDAEARSLLERGLAIPAYDHVLKTSHVFNILDSRGAIGVTERARFFARMRNLARQCAKLWVETRENLNFPLGIYKQVSNVPIQPPEKYPQSFENASRTFVLEIGSEELPPDDVASAISQLNNLFIEMLKHERIGYGEVKVEGTPRRLSVIISNLESFQPSISSEIRGPPASKSFDSNKKATKALEGFCRKNNVNVDDVYIKSDDKGVEYAYAKVEEKGKSTPFILSQQLPSLIASISFVKTMRWNSEVAYSRPIRWLLSIYGNEIIPFSYSSILSNNKTHLLRNSPSPIVEVNSAEEYINTIKNGGIMLNVQERCEKVWEEGSKLAKTIGAKIPLEFKKSLLLEVANLVEYPVPLMGQFDGSFLALPREVLVTVMKKHQRYFPLENEKTGELISFFIAVPNGKLDEELVRKGNEAVLRARYEDAKFFYNSDIQNPLESYREKLNGIIFQEKLGSMLDKSHRVQSLVESLGKATNLDEKTFLDAQKAAKLANADLATSMVMEFTSLAGSMGKHYAQKEGLSPQISESLYEFVLPRFAGDDLPKSDIGILLAISDRLDSLVSLFSVSCEPNSNADAFGLRRSAYALVQTLIENKKNLNLNELLQMTANVQTVKVENHIIQNVLTFILRRFEQLMVDQGYRIEIIRSVVNRRGNIPALAYDTVIQMEEMYGKEEFDQVVSAYSRPTRIVRGKEVDPSWKVEEGLFQSKEEAELWNAYQVASSNINTDKITVKEFITASKVLVDPLDSFFTNVFVMVDDEKLRQNRLALLNQVASLPDCIADLAELPGF